MCVCIMCNLVASFGIGSSGSGKSYLSCGLPWYRVFWVWERLLIIWWPPLVSGLLGLGKVTCYLVASLGVGSSGSGRKLCVTLLSCCLTSTEARWPIRDSLCVI